MIRLASTWLLLPLVTAALLAGCGSSSKSSSTSSSSTAASTAAGSGSTASSSDTTPQPPSSGSEVASCKQGVGRLPEIPASTRARLEKICEKASSGDKEAVRKAAEEGCRELVNASPLPAGSAKNRALAACSHAGGSASSGK